MFQRVIVTKSKNTRVLGITHSASARRRKGSMISSNRNKARDIKSCTYSCYVRCSPLIVWVGRIPCSQTGATHYHAQLGLQDKVCAIKGLVVCYVVRLGSIKWMILRRTGLNLRYTRGSGGRGTETLAHDKKKGGWCIFALQKKTE